MDNSAKQKLILEIRTAVDSLPAVRQDKVTYLQLQIQKNLYRPNPDDIARRMVEESLQEILWQSRKPFKTNRN
jgi:hypothetical protein